MEELMTTKEVVQRWNALPNVRKVRLLTIARENKLKLRLKELSVEHWEEIFEKLKESSFCSGDNSRGWVANFDWFLRPDTPVKILEGLYDDRTVSKPENTFANQRQQNNVRLLKRAQQGEFGDE